MPHTCLGHITSVPKRELFGVGMSASFREYEAQPAGVNGQAKANGVDQISMKKIKNCVARTLRTTHTTR